MYSLTCIARGSKASFRVFCRDMNVDIMRAVTFVVFFFSLFFLTCSHGNPFLAINTTWDPKLIAVWSASQVCLPSYGNVHCCRLPNASHLSAIFPMLFFFMVELLIYMHFMKCIFLFKYVPLFKDFISELCISQPL